MAGDWTKIEHALPDKPEVIAMSLRLGIEIDLVVGKLLRLWRWVDVHADIHANLDGHVHGVDNAWVDAHVRQDGFALALKSEKWLRNKRGGIIFPKIGKHLGEGAKARAGEAVRKHMQRGKCPDKCPDVRPDQRREEKSRREKRKSKDPPVVPPELCGDRFASAWERWVRHRRELRKSLTPSTVSGQYVLLAKLGADEAIARIDRSITNGWTGLDFPTDRKGSGDTARQAGAAQQRRSDKAEGEFAESAFNVRRI